MIIEQGSALLGNVFGIIGTIGVRLVRAGVGAVLFTLIVTSCSKDGGIGVGKNAGGVSVSGVTNDPGGGGGSSVTPVLEEVNAGAAGGTTVALTTATYSVQDTSVGAHKKAAVATSASFSIEGGIGFGPH